MNFTIESKSNSKESREISRTPLTPLGRGERKDNPLRRGEKPRENPTKNELANLGEELKKSREISPKMSRRELLKLAGGAAIGTSVLGKVLNALSPTSANASEFPTAPPISTLVDKPWKNTPYPKNRWKHYIPYKLEIQFEKVKKYNLQPFNEKYYQEALKNEKDPLVIESMKNFARNAHELENLRAQCMNEKNHLEWFKKEAENFAKKLRAYDIKGECAKIAELQKTNPHEYAVKLGKLTDELSFQLQTANTFIKKAYALASGQTVYSHVPASGSTFEQVDNHSYDFGSEAGASPFGFYKTIERVKNPPQGVHKDRCPWSRGGDEDYLNFFAKFDTQPAIQELVKEKGVVYEMSRVMRDFFNNVPWKRPDLQELTDNATGINGLTRRLNIYLSTYGADNPYKLFREDFDWYRSLQEGVSQEYVDLRRLDDKIQRFVKARDFFRDLLKPPPFPEKSKKIFREQGRAYNEFSREKFQYKNKTKEK